MRALKTISAGGVCLISGMIWGTMNSFQLHRSNAILFPNSKITYFDWRYEWAFLPQKARALIFIGIALVLFGLAAVLYKSVTQKRERQS
jgi:hypothetical protein